MVETEQEADAERDARTDAPQGSGRRAAPEGAPLHPLIDLSRDPNPGRPNHAKPEDDEDDRPGA